MIQLARITVIHDILYQGESLAGELARRGLAATAPRTQGTADAINYCRAHPPDLLLVDLRLADGAACELIQQVRLDCRE